MLASNTFFQPSASIPVSTNTRGSKRKTEDDLASEQRLAKRFHLLSLGIPKHKITAEDIQRVHLKLENSQEFTDQSITSDPPRLRRSRSNAISDTMNVDESRDRIFIHNLEDELADLSSEEDNPIFIPDIERKLNALPRALLRPDRSNGAGNELILYEIPTSLTIPIEQDSTRKAIIESRQRAQEQLFAKSSRDTQSVSVDMPMSYHGRPQDDQDDDDDDDDDAMDMS